MSNEPIHPFFCDTPTCTECAKQYQRGVVDGIRIGENKTRDEAIWMVNQFLKHLESKVGEAMIIDLKEKIAEEKQKMREG